MMACMHERDYAKILRELAPLGDRRARMSAAVDVLWQHLSTAGVSWVGFYLHAGSDELVLGPLRNSPACSPIGLHGVCGQAFTQRTPRIVDDVRELGEAYVACDPRDLSELVIPLFEPDGACWGVLDLDSREVGAFSQADVDGLLPILRRAGLTT